MFSVSPQPNIEVRVRLAVPGVAQAADSVAVETAKVYSALGMQIRAQDVRVRILNESERDLYTHPEFLLNGRVCPYDRRLTEAVALSVAGRRSDAESEAEYVGVLCRSALTTRPELLLNDGIVQAWSEALPGPDIRPFLRSVLRARLPVNHLEIVHGMRPGDVSVGQAAENYIASLSMNTIVVRVSRPLFDEIARSDEELDQQLQFMRDGLFVESGVVHPVIAIEPWPELRDYSFAIVLNELESAPLPAPKS